jgi:hypothetical protein
MEKDKPLGKHLIKRKVEWLYKFHTSRLQTREIIRDKTIYTDEVSS